MDRRVLEPGAEEFVITLQHGCEVIVALLSPQEAGSFCRDLMLTGHRIARIQRGDDVWDGDRLMALIAAAEPSQAETHG